jgi:hypothetical protein
LEDHLELHSRQFEDFSSLLEQTTIDEGDDGLGAGGPHTNLNNVHIIEVLKQTTKRLQTDLPGEAEISEIEADIAKMVAKEAQRVVSTVPACYSSSF